MQKPQQTLQALRELKGLGVQIALDDFGVGLLLARPPEAPARGLPEDRPLVHRRRDHGQGRGAPSPPR